MSSKKSKIITAFVMIILSISIIILANNIIAPAGCTTSSSDSILKKDGFYFDTYISITIYDPKYSDLLDECMSMCADYEKIFSRTDSTSELYKLNKYNETNFGTSYDISSDLYECIKQTLLYSEAFGKKYSILAGNLCDLWNYEQEIVPTDEDIRTQLKSIKAFNIALGNNSLTIYNTSDETTSDNITTKEEVAVPSINLGASAKGYVADKLCQYLVSKGVTDAIIDLGGNIVVIGDKIDNSSYKIGIKKPFSIEDEVAAICKISDTSLVTSGIYERYFKADDKIYHHIIDCQTGYPTDNDILSVTIITKNALQADCYSTGCLLLGKDDALTFINNQKEVECVIIDTDYNIHLSDGLTYEENFIVLK